MSKTTQTTQKKPRPEDIGLPIEETKDDFVTRWNRLISTTNWEKGQIISEWRDRLEDSGTEPSTYSDEAWSLCVGGVSPQHVGRLRRVYQRFGQVWHDYNGLFWSHFLGAVDWPDAEMWLEGAVQNHWTVADMRNQRWDTLGRPPELKPRPQDMVAADLDEDVVLDLSAGKARTLAAKTDTVRDPGGGETFSPDFGDEPTDHESSHPTSQRAEAEAATKSVSRVKPFAQLAELPADLSDAFESFKLAILRHKSDGWKEVSRDDVLSTLDALKELALAP